MAERPFLTSIEVSERYDIPTETLAYWRNSAPPRGPAFHRIGRAVRYYVADLEAYEQAQRVETAA